MKQNYSREADGSYDSQEIPWNFMAPNFPLPYPLEPAICP
jgi:hypothetical protein